MELFNGIISKIKNWLASQDRKKLIENTVIFAIIGVIIIIAGSVIFKRGNGHADTPDDPGRQSVQISSSDAGQPSSTGDALESRLKTLLSQVQGVGKVDVMITYSTTTENVPAYDVKKRTGSTEEKDSTGGTRSITEEELENTLAYEDSGSGGKSPVILKKLEPQVKGVLVVAEGADIAEVRAMICNAVSVVLDIPVHKVEVVQRKK
jgi:stage III sporulation protein AG